MNADKQRRLALAYMRLHRANVNFMLAWMDKPYEQRDERLYNNANRCARRCAKLYKKVFLPPFHPLQFS